MSLRNRFFLEWLILNPIGFTAGSLHGATNGGLVTTVIPGLIGLVLGDLIFGAMFGTAQYLAFRRTNFLPASLWWIVASSIGFTLGARTGSFLTFRIVQDWMLAGVVFGIFMGTSVGLATAFVLFKRFSPVQLLIWLGTCILAWIAGESIAFASHFSLLTVPLVAVAIAGITGLGLMYIQPRLPAN